MCRITSSRNPSFSLYLETFAAYRESERAFEDRVRQDLGASLVDFAALDSRVQESFAKTYVSAFGSEPLGYFQKITKYRDSPEEVAEVAGMDGGFLRKYGARLERIYYATPVGVLNKDLLDSGSVEHRHAALASYDDATREWRLLRRGGE